MNEMFAHTVAVYFCRCATKTYFISRVTDLSDNDPSQYAFNKRLTIKNIMILFSLSSV